MGSTTAANLRWKAAAAGRAQELSLQLCGCCSGQCLPAPPLPTHPVTACLLLTCPPYIVPAASPTAGWQGAALSRGFSSSRCSAQEERCWRERRLQRSRRRTAAWPGAPAAAAGPAGASAALPPCQQLAEGCGESREATALPGKPGER